MVRVNLLPAAYELRCQRHLRLRRWIAAGVIVVGLQVAGTIALRQMGSRSRELQRGLADAEMQRVTLNQRLDELTSQENDLQRQLKLAEKLNRKHRWSELLAAVSSSLPNTVILTQCESDPPRSANQKASVVQVARPGDKPAPAEAGDVAGGLVIGGVALDHDSVASFLRNLNASGRVGRCSLESSMRQPYLKGEGVFFTIKTRW
jgi:Tfp pilus assembly protein PilN